jgi:pimeloyl-ACP methyl ester carboxylesterase
MHVVAHGQDAARRQHVRPADGGSLSQRSTAESADIVEELVAHLSLDGVDRVVHDYGAIVGQELLDRRRRDALGFAVRSVTVLNRAIVYSAYRPTTLQKPLIKPVLGRLVASRVTASPARAGLDAVRGAAKVTAPGDTGHFPQSESPRTVAATIRGG